MEMDMDTNKDTGMDMDGKERFFLYLLSDCSDIEIIDLQSKKIFLISD